MQKQFSRKDIFHNGSGALQTLTASFVSVDYIDVGPQSEVSLEISSGGTGPTSIIVQVEVSYDAGVNYKILENIPKDGIILLAEMANPYILLLQPDARYLMSFKHDGTGDGTTTLLVVGSSRRPYGVRLANKDFLESAAYDPVTDSDKVTIIDQPIEVEGPVADDVASTASPPVKQGGVAVDVLTAVTAGKIVHAVHDLFRRKRVVDATHDTLQDANSVNVKNSPQFHYKYRTVAEVTSGGIGTYDYYIDMTTYKKSVLHFILGTTATFVVKLYGIAQGDGTVPADCQEIDITEDTIFVDSFGVTTAINDNIEKLAAWHYVHIEVVTTVASDNWTIFLSKLH